MSLAVDLTPYRLRFHGPFVTASGTYTHRDGALVRMDDGEGTTGWGEIAPLPEHGSEALGLALETAGDMAGTLAAKHASGEWSLPATFDELREILTLLALEHQGSPAALASFDGALADLASRRARLTLSKWVHSDARAVVPVNATVGAVSAHKARRRALSLTRQGFGSIKVKIGRDELADIERVAAMRDAVGSGVRLRADANGAWEEVQAEAMLESLAPARLEYVEQPVAAHDIEAMARLRTATRVPVAADESLLEPDGVARVLDAEAADVLVLKPALLGGLVASWDAAEAARARGVRVVVTTSLDAAVGRTHALHLAAALPNVSHACGLATGGMLAEDVVSAPEPRGGVMDVPDAPGLGIVPHASD